MKNSRSCLRWVSKKDQWKDFVIDVPTQWFSYAADTALYAVLEAADMGLHGREVLLHVVEILDRDRVEHMVLELERDYTLLAPPDSWYKRLEGYYHISCGEYPD